MVPGTFCNYGALEDAKGGGPFLYRYFANTEERIL
jgi:hypothetical protein